MNKYKGKYRIIAEYYRDNVKNKMCINKSCATYVPCSGGHQIYRYDKTKLVLECANVQFFNARVEVLKQNKIWFEISNYSDGGDIIFKEKDFESILKLSVGKGKFLRPSKRDKKIDPYSIENIPKEYRDDPSLF